MSLSSIPLAGVIGYPVAHSKSPQLHGHWLHRYGITGYYMPLEVAPENLGRVIDALPDIGFVGANVTIPHKETVMGVLDEISESASAIGAVNTLVFKDGKVLGDNTDGYGFIANLRQGAPDWRADAGPAVVLGAGGAARAIVFALLEAGVPEILITNRTRSRAEKLQADFGERLHIVDWDRADEVFGDAATVVNTTSLGMSGKPPLEVSLAKLTPEATVTDIVYAPLKTDLLRKAEEKGCVTVDGLGMLLHQAVPGFEQWFGTRPEVDNDLRQAVLS